MKLKSLNLTNSTLHHARDVVSVNALRDALYENTQSAVKAMGISVEVEYITDLKKVMEYGVMSVPALVVNNKVVSTGKVLKTENVQKLLQKIVSEK